MGKILLHEESEANVSDSFLKDTRANAQARIIGLICRKGLLAVVRTYQEMDVWPVSPSSTIQDVSNRAQKWNVGPERRKGLGTSRAFVWGNARHFCDCELNYIGCESSRSTTQGCEQKGHQHLLMSFFVSCVVEFEKAETQAFLALSARLFKSLTAKFEPSSLLSALCRTLVFH